MNITPDVLQERFCKDKMMVFRPKLNGWNITDIRKTINIFRTSFYRYWNRYQKDGFDGLKEYPFTYCISWIKIYKDYQIGFIGM